MPSFQERVEKLLPKTPLHPRETKDADVKVPTFRKHVKKELTYHFVDWLKQCNEFAILDRGYETHEVCMQGEFYLLTEEEHCVGEPAYISFRNYMKDFLNNVDEKIKKTLGDVKKAEKKVGKRTDDVYEHTDVFVKFANYVALKGPYLHKGTLMNKVNNDDWGLLSYAITISRGLFPQLFVGAHGYEATQASHLRMGKGRYEAADENYDNQLARNRGLLMIAVKALQKKKEAQEAVNRARTVAAEANESEHAAALETLEKCRFERNVRANSFASALAHYEKERKELNRLIREILTVDEDFEFEELDDSCLFPDDEAKSKGKKKAESRKRKTRVAEDSGVESGSESEAKSKGKKKAGSRKRKTRAAEKSGVESEDEVEEALDQVERQLPDANTFLESDAEDEAKSEVEEALDQVERQLPDAGAFLESDAEDEAKSEVEDDLDQVERQLPDAGAFLESDAEDEAKSEVEEDLDQVEEQVVVSDSD